MIRLAGGFSAFIAATALMSSSAGAQTAGSDLVAQLSACRSVSSDAERLACFDRTASALEAARAGGEVVILDREEVEETRRRSFGLDLNVLNPFAREGGVDEIDNVSTTLEQATQAGGAGRWLFTLENGSVWRQVDNEPVRVSPRQGMSVEIRRASLGSYMMSINGSRSVRVRRER